MEERKQGELGGADQIIIEEKITNFKGDVSIKRYQRGRLLGRGGFAKCYETTNLETKKVFAAKIIQKSSLARTRAKQKLISEIKIHKSVNHQHIVEFVHVFEDNENVYILLGICSNNTLNELLKRRRRLKEIEVQCYLLQVISALKYLHDMRIIHRDLKLGNLFLNEAMELKLGDFGLATRLEYEGELKKTVCGTPNYIAPEILESQGHSVPVDIWSLGVIIYTQIIGKPPFQTNEVKTTYRKIKTGRFQYPDHIVISDNVKNLINRILVLEPAKRPSLDDILAHPFLTSNPIPKTMPKSSLACPPSTSEVAERRPAPPAVVRPVTTTTSSANQHEQPVVTMVEPAESVPQQGRIQSVSSTRDIKSKEVYVKKWVDYSNKYGLGYILTNGETGVYFNDSTKLTLSANKQTLRYIEKKMDRTENISTFKVTELPSSREITKKYTLLTHFRTYLESDEPIEHVDSKSDSTGTIFYVKKWMKTKYAILFRLSNKIVQVNFTDKTELLLSSEHKQVTYVNRTGVRKDYHLVAAMESDNHEMTKRLKYTRELLTHMLNGSNPNHEKEPVPQQEPL